MFPRKVYSELEKHLMLPAVTVLTGMRRTGKTTTLKHLMEKVPSQNKLYLDLERLDNRELFAQENYEIILEGFVQRGLKIKEKTFVFLDEIQLVPNMASVLKYLLDNHPIKFVVTGSSSFYLKNVFSESLAGRKKIFEIYPLDFSEFLVFKGVIHKKDLSFEKKSNEAEYKRLGGYYEEYLAFGGFPAVVNAGSVEEKKDILFDILDSYINLDIKTLADFRSIDNVYKLLKLLSQRAGTKLDYSKLSRLLGISRATVLNYIDFFEKTYIISRVPVFTSNPDKELVKAQKVYFSDNGFLDILSEIDSGSKFENGLFNQLRHLGKIQYFSLKSGREIDFVLDGKIALEAKENPTEIDQKTLDNLAEKAGISQRKLIGRHMTTKFSDFIWGGDVR